MHIDAKAELHCKDLQKDMHMEGDNNEGWVAAHACGPLRYCRDESDQASTHILSTV